MQVCARAVLPLSLVLRSHIINCGRQPVPLTTPPTGAPLTPQNVWGYQGDYQDIRLSFFWLSLNRTLFVHARLSPARKCVPAEGVGGSCGERQGPPLPPRYCSYGVLHMRAL